MSLDDFGSQYANLSLFTNVKFETVKLDRSLIADLGGNPISRMLVRDLVEICKSCNMTCVAEGVETEEQISALLEMAVIPVVNENDSVSSAEIETGRHKVLGDNDTLSAIVARLCRADLLVLLSDIDGLYDADPKTHPDATLIHQVADLTPQILEMAGGAGSWRGTGGMATKLSAARIAMNCGCDMVITNGKRVEDLYGIVEGQDIGTRFLAAR